MPVYPDLWGSQNKIIFLIINYGSLWIINLMLITGVRFNWNFPITNMQNSAFTHPHNCEISPTDEGHPYVGRLWIKHSLSSPQTRPAVTILALITDSWCLCDDCFVLSQSQCLLLIQNSPTWKGCCFEFSLNSEFWVLGCCLVGLTNNPTPNLNNKFSWSNKNLEKQKIWEND